MRWLSAGLTFVNAWTVFGLLLGIAAHGLNRTVAIASAVLGLAAAFFAYWSTTGSPPARQEKEEAETIPVTTSKRKAKRSRPREVIDKTKLVAKSLDRYRSFGLWLLIAVFAIFAFRSFCWLLYMDGNSLKVQSPNNLGDLSLHISYIKNFASGVPLWPDNPIYIFSKMRYPAGTDLFNALLLCVGVDVIRGLVWAGLAASVATCYALYRWGGSFTIAAFLFNGGLVGFKAAQGLGFIDYQGDKTIAWKSIPLAMFVTQRGLLYALPAGLLLLYQWRAKYFAQNQGAAVSEPAKQEANASGGLESAAPWKRAPLPFWLELSLYATLPLFHVHTFLALSIVLAFLFLLGNAEVRKQSALLVGAAFLPATYLLWLVTDNFNAGSVMKWLPGWVNQPGSDFAMPFPQFWLVNFGAWVPLVLFFIGVTAWTVWKNYRSPDFKIPASVAFLLPAIAIFLLGYLVKTAPWEWDNIKIIIWAYLIILPLLWNDLMARWPIQLRAGLCVALFGSGFVSLIGGLAAPGYGLGDRAEVDAVGLAVKKLPPMVRFAAFPTYNHPLLLQGRKLVLGYPGHLWTQGFDDYGTMQEKLSALMKGAPEWKSHARFFQARYLFWGREEKTNYPKSTRPWEKESKRIATGPWGAIYDLESPPEPAAVPPGEQARPQ